MMKNLKTAIPLNPSLLTCVLVRVVHVYVGAGAGAPPRQLLLQPRPQQVVVVDSTLQLYPQLADLLQKQVDVDTSQVQLPTASSCCQGESG